MKVVATMPRKKSFSLLLRNLIARGLRRIKNGLCAIGERIRGLTFVMR